MPHRDSGNEAQLKRDPSVERRHHARSEDNETETVIRKYMKLAERALKHSTSDDGKRAPTTRYFERAQRWWQRKKAS